MIEVTFAGQMGTYSITARCYEEALDIYRDIIVPSANRRKIVAIPQSRSEHPVDKAVQHKRFAEETLLSFDPTSGV